eukprot:COSAG06_NODE_1291_length_9980_cov_166.860237_3_plen_73_part_00
MRCSQAMELRRPPPPGTTLEDVPGTGACLFHAIAMTQDVDEARVLRQVRNAIFAPILYKMHLFTKTGSGQTQ